MSCFVLLFPAFLEVFPDIAIYRLLRLSSAGIWPLGVWHSLVVVVLVNVAD